MRKEKDFLGELSIPDEVYYGIQTQRAVDNFNFSGGRLWDYPKFIYRLC